MKLAVIAPGTPSSTRSRAAGHRDRRRRRRRAELPSRARARRDVRRGRRTGALGRDVHAEAGHLLACPVGREREAARQGLAALLRDPRRVRAPHGERERLLAGRGARDPAQHLRVPHAVPRLERRRLQLPRRQVRPDLGGPRRWRRPSGGRGAHARLQRLRVRDVGDRQLRDRAPLERRCSRPTAACSRGSCRCTASTPPPPRQVVGPDTFQAINGHRDAGSTACPGRYLYAKIPQIRRLAAAAQRGWDGRQLESNLASTVAPRPDRPARQRRAGLHHPDRWPPRLRRGRGPRPASGPGPRSSSRAPT